MKSVQNKLQHTWRDSASESAKKEEFITYKKLSLSREHKSKALRRKVEQSRAYIYIGGKSPHRPYLKAPRAEYVRLWDFKNKELQKRLKESMPSLSYEELNNIKQLMLADAVYDELAQKLGESKRMEIEFYRQHGRSMTAHEESIYLSALHQKASEKPEEQKPNPLNPMHAARKYWVEDIVEKIKICQRKGTLDLQSIWAGIVGAEIARDTFLEKIDALRGLAFCRCLSSTLLFQLKRKPNLTQELSQAVGVKVQKIIFV